jgi:hypothetical protein
MSCHSQAAAFQQAKSRTVQQDRHEPWHAVELLEDGADLVACQHDGQVLGPLGPDDVVEPRELDAEHLTIEEKQGAQGLVLGGGRDFVVNGERRQERGDFGRAHLSRVALVVEEDVPLDPVDVRLLGAAAIVPGADGLAHAVEEAGFRRRCRTGFTDGERSSEGAFRRDGIRDLARPWGDDAHALEGPLLLVRLEHS